MNLELAQPVGKDHGYPYGVRIALDRRTVIVDRRTVLGGTPARVLTLSGAGRRALDQLLTGPVASSAGARLARRLTDAGIAHPVLGPGVAVAATVVIPVRDRPFELDRCLRALGQAHPVIVVDDASTDPVAVSVVCARHGARLIRHPDNRGPAAARNTGLAAAATPDVLFLDSDCIPRADLIATLAAHFVDPAVGAVAPRVVGQSDAAGALGRYERAHGGLDLGPEPALVQQGGRVSYVPTAALLVRRLAVAEIGLFDPDLRFGEDVDLVWRLAQAGWRVRYEPAVHVEHEEPDSWRGLLARRFRYGTSAGPLAVRHPGALAPIVVPRAAAVVALGLTARQPWLVAVGVGAMAGRGVVSLRRAGIAARPAAVAATRSSVCSVAAIGRWLGQFGLPVAVGAAAAPSRRRAGLGVLALLVAGPHLRDWWSHRNSIDPLRYLAARLADDAAYGAGVVSGAMHARTAEPIRPVFARSTARRSQPNKEAHG